MRSGSANRIRCERRPPGIVVAGLLFLCLGLQNPSATGPRLTVSKGLGNALNAKLDKLVKIIYRTSLENGGEGCGQQRRSKNASNSTDESQRFLELDCGPDGRIHLDLAVELVDQGAAELKRAGFAVYGQVGDVATIASTIDRLPELAALKSVSRISGSRYYSNTNDRAAQGIGVMNPSGLRQVAQTGRGVIVGVIDTGIDFRHPDFMMPGSNGQQTRIRALLDMTVYDPNTVGGTTTDANWNYTLQGGDAPIGRLYTESDINAALQIPRPADQNGDLVKERDKNGHGTHVAGTAAGNGLGAASNPGLYAGMAPEADLIIVKGTRSDSGEYRYLETDQINALSFIKEQAAILNEPFVINMSYGDYVGPHDGSRLLDHAIDSLVNSGPGRSVCVAAGNSGNTNTHASGSVPAGGDVDLNIAHPPGDDFGFLEMYSSGSDRFTVTVTKPNGNLLGPFHYDAGPYNDLAQGDPDIHFYNTTDPLYNNKNNIFMSFTNSAKTLGSAPWVLRFHGDSVPAGGHFDAWIQKGAFTTFANSAGSITTPGESLGAITVGAWNTRGNSSSINNYASFTSVGPTVDGRLKPDISAPGSFLYSSRSADGNQQAFVYGSGSDALAPGVSNSLYGGLEGTSMSTPVTSGAVALIYQANRNLTIDQLKSVLTTTATHDSFTGPGWSPRFGYGKLNVNSALTVANISVINLSANPSPIVPRPCGGCGSGSTDLEAVTNLTIQESGGVAGTVTSIDVTLRDGSNAVLASGTFDSNGVTFFAGSNRLTANGSLVARNIGVHYAQGLAGREATINYTVHVTDDNGNQIVRAINVPVAPPIQAPTILLEEGTNRAAALDSVTFIRGPFPITETQNFSADHHTRVIFFTSSLGLSQPDASVLAVQAGGMPLLVENVGALSGVAGLNASYIIVRLPDGLPAGDLPLTVIFHGLVSTNTPTLGIAP